MAKPRVPHGLGDKAKAKWREIIGVYELRPDEVRILEDACREIDLIERLEKEQRGSPLLVTGSMGQKVASPLMQELRQHRAVLRQLLTSLKLPDDPGQESGQRSTAARAAAAERWKRGA